MNTDVPALVLTPADPSLKDFPDRLSPMLVKELRQGLRSNIFVWAFLIMHFVLAFVVLSALGSENDRNTSSIFWWTIILPIVFVLPLRGVNALSEEIRMNTMDTLCLTRLTALRITFGKWVSIALQIILLGVTVLPYLVMRYFAGGVDIAIELLGLFNLLAVGCVFTAVTVGFSWLRTFLLRSLLTGAALFFLWNFCWSYIRSLSYSGMGSGFNLSDVLASVGLSYFVGAFIVFYLLDFAAAQIAPVAENRSSLRRAISLAVIVICMLVGIFAPAPLGENAFALTVGLAFIVGLDAATEQPKHLTVIVHPFVKRGFLGRLAGRFLYPGWHTGLAYILLLVAIVCFVHWNYSFSSKTTRYHVAFLGQIFFGMVIQRQFFRSANWNSFVGFAVIQLLVLLFWAMLKALEGATNSSDVLILGAFLPIAYLDNYISTDRLTWITSLTVIYLVCIVLISRREFRITRHLEDECLSDAQFQPQAPVPTQTQTP